MKSKFDNEEKRWSGLYTNNAKNWAFFPEQAKKRVEQRKKICMEWLEGNKIADLGCNGAHYGIDISKKRNWTGMDISLNMLKAGKKRFQINGLNGNFINGNITAIPFKNKSFDTVITIGVLNYFKKKQIKQIISEISQIVKDDGAFIFTSLSFDIFNWIRSRLPAYVPRPIRLPGPLYTYKNYYVLNVLKQYGFICSNTVLLKKYRFLPYITIMKAWKSKTNKNS